MAGRLKAVPDASRDLISELPLEVKDRILGCLCTPEAARTAMLSKHWNDVWLQHGRLTFDWEFLQCVEQCYDDEGITLVNIIDKILFFRAGPVKKFTLQISSDDPRPQQSDFDKWCLFLSRNGVEELNICLDTDEEEYKLPFCLLYCRTIKQLIVRRPFIDLPVNACEAARTAMLSKHWNDVWLQHGQLAFDSDFLESVEQWYDGEGRTLVNVINNILFFRDGPVKKFTLRISYDDPTPQQSDFDRWCLFLSRNGVEELKICLHTDAEEYKLPFCLLSCRTIKQLIVCGPFIDLPVNACDPTLQQSDID
nr:F-box/FBD/LRR-repeat protein At1g13570-like [Ipomoea batatas]